MILLIPFKRIALDLSLTSDEALELLSQSILIRQWPKWRVSRDEVDFFEGNVTENGFNIHRIIGYTNSFRPQLVGTVYPAAEGSHLEITLELHPVAKVWVC